MNCLYFYSNYIPEIITFNYCYNKAFSKGMFNDHRKTAPDRYTLKIKVLKDLLCLKYILCFLSMTLFVVCFSMTLDKATKTKCVKN